MNKIALLALLSLTLCACGVKPNNVDPPDEVKNKEFPRTYPAPDMNPPPYVPPPVH